jgi:hypothetical protein
MTFRLGIDIGLATVAVIAVAIAVIAVLSRTGDVSEGNGLQDGPHLGGDGVITHPPDDDPPIENRRRFIQQGERIDGICQYTVMGERQLGEPGIIGRVLAENPNTCEQLVEEGTLSEEGKGKMEEEDRRAGGAIATVIPKQAK